MQYILQYCWKPSRPGWTGLWAAWSSWRYPCSLQGVWTSKGPFQLTAFYDSNIYYVY